MIIVWIAETTYYGLGYSFSITFTDYCFVIYYSFRTFAINNVLNQDEINRINITIIII